MALDVVKLKLSFAFIVNQLMGLHAVTSYK